MKDDDFRYDLAAIAIVMLIFFFGLLLNINGVVPAWR